MCIRDRIRVLPFFTECKRKYPLRVHLRCDSSPADVCNLMGGRCLPHRSERFKSAATPYGFSNRFDRRSPIPGIYIAGVFREQPTVALNIFHSVLLLSVHGFVKLLPNTCASPLCAPEMSIDICNDDGKSLSTVPKLRRAVDPRTWTGQHDVSISQIHLDAAQRLPIAEVFSESQCFFEPVTGPLKVTVNQMGKQGSGRYGPVIHAGTVFGSCST